MTSRRKGRRGWARALALMAPGATWFSSAPGARADMAIVKTLDRKFPTGKFCPLEARAAAGANLSFDAPGSSARITLYANNRMNDCEAYDLASGQYAISTGSTWTLTIRIASTRLQACGF